MSQGDLFDAAGGRERRDQGIERRIGNAPEWHERALPLLLRFAEIRGRFTSDDFRAYATSMGLDTPSHANSWGALFNTAAKAGRISNTGTTEKTKRKSGQARRIAVWESV